MRLRRVRLQRTGKSLVTFYNAMDGPNWEDSGNWLSDSPLGEWSGVQTDDNGRVIYLQMGGTGSRQELSGEIPLELIDLGALKVLGLNDYSGGLRGEIPPEFGNFPNLENLSLGGDGLTGEIPPELGQHRQPEGFVNQRERVDRGDSPRTWRLGKNTTPKHYGYPGERRDSAGTGGTGE